MQGRARRRQCRAGALCLPAPSAASAHAYARQDGCTIGAACVVAPGEVVETGTIIYGPLQERRIDKVGCGARRVGTYLAAAQDGLKKNTNDIKPLLAMVRQLLPTSHKLYGAGVPAQAAGAATPAAK